MKEYGVHLHVDDRSTHGSTRTCARRRQGEMLPSGPVTLPAACSCDGCSLSDCTGARYLY
jgi:hypothetical protein